MRPETPLDPEKQTTDVLGAPLAFTETGAGPVVVAIHGLPANANDYRWLDAAFDGRVRFFRLDLPGFGASPPRDPEPDFHALSEVVAAFCEAKDLDGVTVMGHSLGGTVAAEAAVRSPRIARAVLVNSAGPRVHRALFWRSYRVILTLIGLHPLVRRGLIRALLPVARTAGFSKRLSTEELIRATRLAAYYPVADVGPLLERLDKPVMVARPDRDPAIQDAVTDAVLAALPRGVERRFEGETHNLQASQAVELADAIVAFAADQSG